MTKSKSAKKSNKKHIIQFRVDDQKKREIQQYAAKNNHKNLSSVLREMVNDSLMMDSVPY